MMHRQIIRREIRKEKEVEKVYSGKEEWEGGEPVLVHCVCRVRMLSCTPSRVSNIQQVTSSIMSCFADIHTLNRRGTDNAQLQEFQVTEFQSYSALFLQTVIKLKEKHFRKTLIVSLLKLMHNET
jgi:hypothetical protein